MDEPPTSFRRRNMTGFGSPCGACKFLRRKCVRDCVFAPYFCNEHGDTHFAAIHKVFGASNVSKHLMHLPIPDRGDAAVTIAYEAQARLQDPVHGCVAHIFTLQQQVVNLQAQLASLKAQASQRLFSISTESLNFEEQKPYTKLTTFQNGGQCVSQNVTMPESLLPPPSINASSYYDTSIQSTWQNISNSKSSLNYVEDDMEELMSIAYGYLHRS